MNGLGGTCLHLSDDSRLNICILYSVYWRFKRQDDACMRHPEWIVNRNSHTSSDSLSLSLTISISESFRIGFG